MDDCKARLARKMQQADVVAEALDHFLGAMIADGMEPDAVLAGAHGLLVSRMSVLLGGAVVAETMRRAADQVKDWPSASESLLVTMPPGGSA